MFKSCIYIYNWTSISLFQSPVFDMINVTSWKVVPYQKSFMHIL